MSMQIRPQDLPEIRAEALLWQASHADRLVVGWADMAEDYKGAKVPEFAQIKIGKDKIATAVRMRKNRDNLGSPETFPETFPDGVPREGSPGTPAETTKPQVNHSPGTLREPSPDPGSPPSPL